MLFELIAGPRESASHRTNVDIQQFGDIFVGHLLHLSEHDDGAVLFAEQLQGRVDQANAFGSYERLVGRLRAIYRIGTCQLSALLYGQQVALPSASAERIIEGDAIQPSKELAITLKRIELNVGLNKRILDHVFGFVVGPNNLKHGAIQPRLETIDEFAVTFGLPFQCFTNQIFFRFQWT